MYLVISGTLITGCPGEKYPKVMAYHYETTHHNVINGSSMDWKTLRDCLGLVRSAARARIIRQSQRITFYTDFTNKEENAAVKDTVRTFVKEFHSVTRVQRHVRKVWNAPTL
ncbi:hypothetical protein TNCV_1596101 [Trichonephila clavipes]|nr:hypothetical protein TNCV_1596101 [Trichonephila clavipes]